MPIFAAEVKTTPIGDGKQLLVKWRCGECRKMNQYKEYACIDLGEQTRLCDVCQNENIMKAKPVSASPGQKKLM